MPLAQRTATTAKPWHLWVIGILGSLWALMGVLSFVFTLMNVEAVMSQFPPQQRQYFQSFPLWAVVFWAIGVAGGVLGCFLLLLRKRLAFHLLVVALVGMAVTNLGGLLLLGGMQVMRDTGGLGATLVPVVIVALLAYYARVTSKRGVLR